MSHDSAELRKFRGNAKGQLTRVKLSISRMKAKGLDDYDKEVVERYYETANKASKGYLEAYHSLLELDPSLSEEQFLQDEEEHLEVMDAVVKMVNYVRICIEIRMRANNLIYLMRDLHEVLEGEYDATKADQYALASTRMDELRALASQDQVRDHPQIADLRATIMTQWKELDKIRKDSGCGAVISPSIATPAAAPSSREAKGIQVDPPVFNGKLEDFQDWKKLFNDVMKHQPRLAESEKNAVLLKCMGTPAAKQQAQLAIRQSTTFVDAMARLCRRYENSREVVAYHLNKILQMKTISQNQEDMQTLFQIINGSAQGVLSAKCLTAEQLLVAIMDGKFSDQVRLAWRQKSSKLDDPPSLDDLREFVEEQERMVSRCVVTTEPEKPPPVKQRQPP